MIRTAYYTSSTTDVAHCPKSTLPEYAFIGRSNVGKSSLINMLTRQDGLAKTSSKPGKTLLINHFLINGMMIEPPRPKAGERKQKPTFQPQADSWYLVDLPGYGFARAGQTQREALKRMIEGYCLYREQLVSLFVLVDSRHAPQKIDLEFMQWLGEQGVPFAIVFTKADKLGRERLKWNIEDYKKALLETWEQLPPMFATSSEDKTGGEELLAYIESVNEEVKKG
ncbi:MAG: YihA family ribosome biogenesis GTP-binding protein [Paludibacteraceae bacterium]|nr:YihA family ribosome biogenesis GTP-binding protein [Paludibacteraceae bacterium]